MVDIKEQGDSAQSKVLTSESAKGSSSVDPKVQVSAQDLKLKGKQPVPESSKRQIKKVTWTEEDEQKAKNLENAERTEEGEPEGVKKPLSVPHQRITSQELINEFQREQEQRRRSEELRRREKEHWRCPFFRHCWEEGLTLPTILQEEGDLARGNGLIIGC